MKQPEAEAAVVQCQSCALSCTHCATASLHSEHLADMGRCIGLAIDCADVCTLTASLLARQSRSAQPQAALCAQVCRACAEECGRHDVSHCQDCAAACIQCAEALERVRP